MSHSNIEQEHFFAWCLESVTLNCDNLVAVLKMLLQQKCFSKKQKKNFKA